MGSATDAAFEVRTDCPRCLVEGAAIEIWDVTSPSSRLGVPATFECRLCSHAARGVVHPATRATAFDVECPACGAVIDDDSRDAHRCPSCAAYAELEETSAGVSFTEVEHVTSALEAWARAEGLANGAELLDACFTIASPRELLDALHARRSIETTFDVTDRLFGGGWAGAESSAGLSPDDSSPPSSAAAVPPPSLRAPSPHDELLALASVAAADGEATSQDVAVLARAAQKRGMPPLDAHQIRVWRPNEIGAPPSMADRERVLEEMFQVGWSDGQMDDSELRVLQEFARAWGIDPERLRELSDLYRIGDLNALERWLRRLSLFLLPTDSTR